MNNKKGDLILGSSVRLIISVLVLVMLIGLLIAVYYILVAENELQKIKKQMDKLEEITKKVHQSGKLSTIDFFPIKRWYLKTFNIGDEGFDGFPIGACVDNRAESCLCVCDQVNCKDKFDCRWFDFKVFIAEEHRVINFPDATEAQMGYSPPDDVYSGTFQLRESIYQFEIAKEGIGPEEWVSIVEPGIIEVIKGADLDWKKILDEYEKTKCVVSENSCQIAEFPCACFTKTDYDLKKNFEICDESTPYCYNRQHGCSKNSPDNPLGLNACKESLGSEFVQAPNCEVDTTSCMILNFPCTCPTKGSLREFNEDNSVALETCVESQYCSYGVHGCTDNSPDNPLGLNACKESLGDKYTEPAECQVDTSTCSVLKSPCTCPTFGDLVDKERGNEYSPGVCSSDQYCYYGKSGCSDRGPSSGGIRDCKEVLGSKFVQASDCKIDGENKVTNAPCTCGTFGGLAQIEDGEDIALETCNAGEYCYVNGVGCSDTKK